jgi:hypothetical protein
MRWAKVVSFVFSAVVVLCGATANADLVNSGFEDVDLTGTGWTTIGHVQAMTDEYSRDILGLPQAPASGFWYPTQGTHFASLWSTDAVLGTSFSSMSQRFDTDRDGLVLRFDYFYDFGDIWPMPGVYDRSTCDPARIFVADSSSQVFFQMTINDPDESTQLGEDVNIDWTPVSVSLPTAGTYTLGFEITSLGDGALGFESILGVDNVNVVPLPPALLLGGLGLGFAGSLLSRFRRGKVSP